MPTTHKWRNFAALGALALSLLALAVSITRAQEPKPADLTGKTEVDQAEILRRGSRVVVSGEGVREAGDLMFSMAMAPPPDDSGMWQIAVWGSSKDPNTLALVKAFESDPNLACFVAPPPGDGKMAWAHFHIFHADDPLQKWRYDAFQIPLTGPFPVVTIQPPRDGSWGGVLEAKDSKGNKTSQAVVIDRVAASELGQPADLRRRLTRSVNLWTEKLAKSGFVPPAKVVRAFYPEDVQLARSDSHGQKAFPWGPAQPPAATPVNPQWPAGGPPADPTPASGGLTIPLALPSLQSVLLLLLTVSNVWMLVRDLLQKAGVKLILTDDQAKKLKDFLDKLTGQNPNSPPASTT